MITWRDQPSFWWYRDEIRCSGPDEAQQLKLLEMARALKAYAIGDDGEIYEGDKGSKFRPTISFGERVAGWLARLRPQRQPVIEHQPIPFGVGDKVRDTWGNEHTVILIDPKAEHGMGVIRTRRSDGTENIHLMIAHGLEPVAK